MPLARRPGARERILARAHQLAVATAGLGIAAAPGCHRHDDPYSEAHQVSDPVVPPAQIPGGPGNPQGGPYPGVYDDGPHQVSDPIVPPTPRFSVIRGEWVTVQGKRGILLPKLQPDISIEGGTKFPTGDWFVVPTAGAIVIIEEGYGPSTIAIPADDAAPPLPGTEFELPLEH